MKPKYRAEVIEQNICFNNIDLIQNIRYIQNNQRLKTNILQMNPNFANFNSVPYNQQLPNQYPQQYTGSDQIFQSYNRKPYEDEQFLDTIFNYKQQYIQAFKTLSHQVKLKFYLSIEEQKMLGKMNDREGYQYILKQITRRVMLIKNEISIQANNQNQDPQIMWGSKLQSLCDNHLKRMQNNDLLDDLPIEPSQNSKINSNSIQSVNFLDYQLHNSPKKHQQKNIIQNPVKPLFNPNLQEIEKNVQDDDEFEWAQPNETTVNNQTSKMQKQQNHQNIVNSQKQWNTYNNTAIQNRVPDMDFHRQNSINQRHQNFNEIPSNKVVYSNHIQSSSNISVQQNQIKPPIDIWDLDIDDAMMEQKNKITQLFHQNKKQVKLQRSQSLKKSNTFRKSVSQIQIYHNHQKHIPKIRKSEDHDEQGLSVKSDVHGKQQSDDSDNDNKMIIGGFTNQNAPSRTTSGPSQNLSQHSDQFYSSNFDMNNNQAIFTAFSKNNSITQDLQTNTKDLYQMNIQQKGQHMNIGYLGLNSENNNIIDQGDDQDQFQWENAHNNQVIQDRNQKVYNQQFIRSSVDVTSIRNTENNIETQVYTVSDEPYNQIYDLDFFNTINTNNEQTEKIKKRQESAIKTEKEQSKPIKSSTFISQTDFSFLNQFLIHAPTYVIQSALKRKYFDFDVSFYEQGLSLIQKLGYQSSEDYKFIAKQKDICNQIFRLSQLKSSAVDQSQEHIVLEAIKKSKQLYYQLDSKQTADILQKYLGLKGESKDIRIAKLSIDASIPKDLVIKAMKSQNKAEILTTLYCIENLSSTQNYSIFCNHVIEYLQSQFDIMNGLSVQLSDYNEEVRKIIRNSQKFQSYRQHFTGIVRICKLFIDIGKVCTNNTEFIQVLDEQLTNILSNESTQKSLISELFIEFYSNFACNPNANIYLLFSEFRNFLSAHQICSLCLKTIQNSQTGAKKGQGDGKYYHYQCWNLEKHIHKFKLEKLKPKQQIKTEKSNEYQNTNSQTQECDQQYDVKITDQQQENNNQV